MLSVRLYICFVRTVNNLSPLEHVMLAFATLVRQSDNTEPVLNILFFVCDIVLPHPPMNGLAYTTLTDSHIGPLNLLLALR